MTKQFNSFYTCGKCGHRTSAETGFGRWMRNLPALDSIQGIVRTDLDHCILRYKTTIQGRDFQLLMIVEVKEYGAQPDKSQIDILSFIRQMIEDKGTNMHGAPTVRTHNLISKMRDNRKVSVRFWGVHLLQFEKTNPDDSSWIKWNRKLISKHDLVAVLAMERRPDRPDKMMDEYLRDRHRKVDAIEFDFMHQLISEPIGDPE